MLDRESRYQTVGKKWMVLASEEKKVKATKEKLRKELLDLIIDEFEEKDFLRPVVSDSIPHSFFEKTGISHTEFIKTRYPGWELLKTINEESSVTFVLQKLPEYVGKVIDLGGAQLSKLVVEYTPEIDWDSLNKEFPELAERISKTIETIAIDEDALAEEVEQNPEIFSILRRHTRTKPPSVRILPRELEDGRE